MYYTHTTFFFQSLLNAFNMCTLVITVPAIVLDILKYCDFMLTELNID